MAFSDVILERNPYTLVLNSSSFQLDGSPCYILNIRDVTQLQRLEKNVRYKLAKTGLTAAHHFSDILTTDDNMNKIKATAETMAAYDAPVLIQGESVPAKSFSLKAFTIQARGKTVPLLPSTVLPCRRNY